MLDNARYVNLAVLAPGAASPPPGGSVIEG